MRSGEEFLFLTPKGTEELRSRAHRLDVAARNILYLIQLGSTTAEAILQRTIFPRDAVIDRLRRLLGNKFVAVAPGNGVSAPVAHAPDLQSVPAVGRLHLEAGISLSQARFSLSDFCLEQFGTQGRGLVDAAGLALDVAGLQQVLNRIQSEVQNRCSDRLTLLLACVGEINKTADETPSPLPAMAAASERGILAEGALHLGSGISISQARFALSDFCLNHFGIRGQDLVVMLEHCADVAALQLAVTRIRDQVLDRCRDRLPALIECVREFNETD
jgi:hypothetical protein